MRLALGLGIAILLFPSCSDDCLDCGGWFRNEPPQVWLAAGPPEGSIVDNPVHFYWGGWDADGAISGYEYIIAQNPTGSLSPPDTVGVYWEPVVASDSIFTLEPDSLNTSRSFSFFIRAVDNEGLRSTDQPHRTFKITLPSGL